MEKKNFVALYLFLSALNIHADERALGCKLILNHFGRDTEVGDGESEKVFNRVAALCCGTYLILFN